MHLYMIFSGLNDSSLLCIEKNSSACLHPVPLPIAMVSHLRICKWSSIFTRLKCWWRRKIKLFTNVNNNTTMMAMMIISPFKYYKQDYFN